MLTSFFKRYRPLLLSLPFLYVAGNIHPIVAVLVMVFPIGKFLVKQDHQGLIIAFLFVIIMGDSREYDLQFFKGLRILVLLAMAWLCIQDFRRKRYKFRPIFLIVILFIISASFSMIRSLTPFGSLQKTISYFLLLLVVVHQWNYVVKKNGNRLIHDVLVLVIICYSFGLFLWLIGSPVASFGVRFRGILGNSNGIGVHGTLAIILSSLYLWAYPNGFSKRSWILLFTVILGSIILSTSRNALVSISLFFLLYFFFKGGAFRKTILILMGIPVAIVFSSMEFIISLIIDLGLGEQLRVETLLSGSGRFFAWEFALELYAENPLMGRGFQFEETIFSEDYVPIWIKSTGHQGGVHNSYLSFLLNTGIVGLSIFMIFLLRMYRNIPNRGIAISIFAATTFSAFFEPWLMSSLNAFTALFFLLLLFATHHTKPFRPSA